jgi:hypothetical protein
MDRLLYAFDQLGRYGDPPDILVQVVETLTDINDDWANGRAPELIRANVEKAKRELDDFLKQNKI